MATNVLSGSAAQQRQQRTIDGGVSLIRHRPILLPAAASGVDGTTFIAGVDATKAFMIPISLGVSVAGLGAETLTLTATLKLSDGSSLANQTLSITTAAAKQYIASDAINGGGGSLIGAGALPLVEIDYKVRSSINNSAAQVQIDLLAYQTSFGV